MVAVYCRELVFRLLCGGYGWFGFLFAGGWGYVDTWGLVLGHADVS